MRVHSPPERLAVAKPLYSQVRDILLGRVRAGEWAAGEALPNEFLLAQQCGVSIGTIRRAIEELEENGVVVRKQGRGTYVSGAGPTALVDRFNRLRIAGDPQIRMMLLSLERRGATAEEAGALGMEGVGDVYEVVQSLSADGIGVGVERSVVAARTFPKLETQVTFGQHLYPVYAHYGVLVTRVAETIGIIAGDALAGEALGSRGATLLSVVRTALSMDRGPVELRRSFYRSDIVSYVAPEA